MQIGAWDFVPGAAFSVPGKVRLMEEGGETHLVRVWLCKKIGKEVSADDCRACHGLEAGRPVCKAENASDPVGSSVLVVVRANLAAKKVWFEDGSGLSVGFLLGMARAGRLKRVERKPAEAEPIGKVPAEAVDNKAAPEHNCMEPD
jgi:hypothetical protein